MTSVGLRRNAKVKKIKERKKVNEGDQTDKRLQRRIVGIGNRGMPKKRRK